LILNGFYEVEGGFGKVAPVVYGGSLPKCFPEAKRERTPVNAKDCSDQALHLNDKSATAPSDVRCNWFNQS
jgi:hypothetical protein